MADHEQSESFLLKPLTDGDHEAAEADEPVKSDVTHYGSTNHDETGNGLEYKQDITTVRSTEPILPPAGKDEDEENNQAETDKTDRQKQDGSTGGKELTFANKVFRTIALNLAYIAVTLSLGILGPSLIDLSILTGASPAHLSTVFTARGILAIIGSIILGPLFDKFNRYLIIAVALFMDFVFMAAVPLCRNLGSLLVALSPPELFGGAIGMGTHLICIDLWGAESGPSLQLLNLISVVGFTMAPLLVKPFLAPDHHTTRHNNTALHSKHTPGVSTKQPKFEIVDINHLSESVQAWTPKDESYVHISDDLKFTPRFPENSTAPPLGNPETLIHYAFLLVGIYSLVICVLFVVIFCMDKCKVRITEETEEEDDDPKLKNTDDFVIKISILFFLFNVFYCGIEIGYAGQLMTFAVTYLGWDKDTGANITACLQASNALVTAAAVVFSRYVKPVYILTVDMGLVILCLLVLTLTVSQHHVLLWVCSIGLGAGYATIMPCTFTWANSFMEVTGKFSSAYWCGFFCGFMAIPALTGYLLHEVHPMWFAYIMLISSLCMCLTFVALCVLVYRRNKRLDKAMDNAESKDKTISGC